MGKIKVYIEPHDGVDKRFDFIIGDNRLEARIDYDDVSHAEVDAATRVLQKIVEENWDEELFKKFHKEELIKVWNENEYDFQHDYDGKIEDYLSEFGFES